MRVQLIDDPAMDVQPSSVFASDDSGSNFEAELS
jgi:hypothetical protein